MIVYADTSFLVKLYVAEDQSHEALTVLRRLGSPINGVWFTILETVNALRLLAFRKIVDERTARDAVTRLRSSAERGMVIVQALSSDEFATAAEGLSNRYAIKTGIRMLDLMHLAAASVLRASHFLTYDECQRSVAVRAGLIVGPPLRRRAT